MEIEKDMKFKISSTKYIEFSTENLNYNLCLTCYKIDIIFVDEEKKLKIRFGYDSVIDIIYFFTKSDLIKKLLAGELKNQINLGLEWNEFFEGINTNTKSGNYFWLGNSHKLIRPYYMSWFYNDEQGNIVFEITPFYPWHDPKEVNNPNFISYDEWIKSYRSIVTTTVPVKNLKQWIKQAQALSKLLEEQDQMSCH